VHLFGNYTSGFDPVNGSAPHKFSRTRGQWWSRGVNRLCSPLGDGLTPSLTGMLANTNFDRSPVKHGTQNIQNDCHQWLSGSFKVHQIRFRPGLRPGYHWGSLQPCHPLSKIPGSAPARSPTHLKTPRPSFGTAENLVT